MKLSLENWPSDIIILQQTFFLVKTKISPKFKINIKGELRQIKSLVQSFKSSLTNSLKINKKSVLYIRRRNTSRCGDQIVTKIHSGQLEIYKFRHLEIQHLRHQNYFRKSNLLTFLMVSCSRYVNNKIQQLQ